MKHLTNFKLFESDGFDPKSTNLTADFEMLNDKLFDGGLNMVPSNPSDSNNLKLVRCFIDYISMPKVKTKIKCLCFLKHFISV